MNAFVIQTKLTKLDALPAHACNVRVVKRCTLSLVTYRAICLGYSEALDALPAHACNVRVVKGCTLSLVTNRH